MSTDNRRRIVLINKRFQLLLIGRFIGVQILLLAIFGGLIYLFLDSELGAELSSAHVTYRNMQELIFPIVLTLSLLNLLFSAVLISAFVLYASHKIAGPLYRFKSVIDAMAQRVIPESGKLRDKDQLEEIFESLNGLSGTLRGDLEAIRSDLEQLEEAGRQAGMPDHLKDPVRDLAAIVGRYQL